MSGASSTVQDAKAVERRVLSLTRPWSLIVVVGVVGAVLALSQEQGCFSTTILRKGGESFLASSMNEPMSLVQMGSLRRNTHLNNNITHLQNAVDANDASMSSILAKKELETEDESNYEEKFDDENEPLEHSPFLSASKLWGFFFASAGLMVAAGGGIGGGGILVPIYILVMGFSPKQAIPLCSITVLGGAMANTMLNVRKRHPLADRPLIDWDLILAMEPLTIAGTLIGAFIHKVLPELVLTILLVLLLSATAWESFGKAMQLYHKETAQFHKQTELLRFNAKEPSELTRLIEENKTYYATDTESTDSEADSSIDEHTESRHSDPDEEQAQPQSTCTNDSDKHVAAIKTAVTDELAIALEEDRTASKTSIYIMSITCAVVLIVNLLKGGGSFRSPFGIVCGSASFWLANLFMLVWIVGVAVYVRNYLVHKWERKRAVGFPFVEGDIEWTPRASVVYPIACCASGFFAGMFGVGGGIVKGPLMLAMGVHPAVASATAACMILFTSFTATTSFIVFGLLVTDYAPICFVTGFLATWMGQVVLSYLMRKTSRNSYIAFSIGTVVLLSSILMTIQSILSMVSGERHRSGGICGVGE